MLVQGLFFLDGKDVVGEDVIGLIVVGLYRCVAKNMQTIMSAKAHSIEKDDPYLMNNA